MREVKSMAEKNIYFVNDEAELKQVLEFIDKTDYGINIFYFTYKFCAKHSINIRHSYKSNRCSRDNSEEIENVISLDTQNFQKGIFLFFIG